MLYTVKEVSTLSGVTVKALHHYHRIGLLMPAEISDAGYRLYGKRELERLQEILFYRELDIPLDKIKELLEGSQNRRTILSEQEELLAARLNRLGAVLGTLRKSMNELEGGQPMRPEEMFKGFDSDEAWKEALKEQNDYLKDTYDVDLLQGGQVQVNAADLNEQAAEASAFMTAMAESLTSGIKHDDERVQRLIGKHLAFLNAHGHSVTPADFAAQTKFFLQDDFHLRMLEEQQTGLAYYLHAAGEQYAALA